MIKKSLSLMVIMAFMFSIILGPVSAKADTIVYTTETGEHYHSTKDCNGLSHARKIYETALSDAQNSGLTPCSLCYGGSSSSGSSSLNSSKTESSQTPADTQLQVHAQTSQKVKLGDYLKISNVKKAKDGTWISMRIKNVSGKRVAVVEYMVIQDKKNVDFAWCNPPKKKYTIIGKDQQKDFKFVSYPYTGTSNPKPKTNQEPIKHVSKQMGYIMTFSCGNEVYVYYNNPLKKMKKCVIYDENTYERDVDQWTNIK